MDEWEEELSMYRITPAPPRENDLQTYIDRYLAEKNQKYFGWFLHYYERIINEKVMGIIQDYAMFGHFSGMKQEYVTGMWFALQKYDPNRGIPFIVYKERSAVRAVHDYIRTMRTGFTVQSEGEYRLLRKAMRWYRECGEKSDYDTMEKIAGRLGKSVGETIEIIQAGLRNTQFIDYYRQYSDEDSREEAASDASADTEYLFFRMERAEAVMAAFERLDYRERAVVSAHLGFCMECYSITGKGQPFIDIAIDHGLASPDTADKIYRRALRKMKTELEQQGSH